MKTIEFNLQLFTNLKIEVNQRGLTTEYKSYVKEDSEFNPITIIPFDIRSDRDTSENVDLNSKLGYLCH